MILKLVNVFYVLIAISMIALILLQRGAGAAAGSGFGAGASATVFGARGASNFLSKSTAILAALFFAISLAMAMYATRGAGSPSDASDLGVMGGAVTAESFETPTAPAAEAPPASVPVAPSATATPDVSSEVPVAPPADAKSDTPPDNGG
jgi:preprotein translocase subunit SecG